MHIKTGGGKKEKRNKKKSWGVAKKEIVGGEGNRHLTSK